MNGDAATNGRVPSGERPAAGTFKFGRRRGDPIAGAAEADLDWYAGWIRKSLADPTKERYREQNERDLAEVEAAMGEGAALVSDEGPPTADDSEIPF